MILHITRHGQVLPREAQDQTNDSEIYTPGDMPLSALGREQAQRLGQRLREMGFAGRIYSSPYLRTIETAQIVAEVVDAPVIPAAPIREFVRDPEHMAVFRGRTLTELRERFSRVAAEQTLPDRWWTCDVEEREHVDARVWPFMSRVCEGDCDALLVGHGASVSAAMRWVLTHHAPELFGRVPRTYNCVLSSFRMRPRFEAIHLSCRTHMADEMVTANAKYIFQEQAEEA